MNTFLINYVKRDLWLNNGVNFGAFLRSKDQIMKKERKSAKQANKIVKRALWRAVRKIG